MLRQVLANDPANGHTINALATLLWQQGKTEDAIAQFKNLHALCPTSPAACNNLGIVLGAIGERCQAMALFRKAVAL